jgi:hypothetical protein
MLNIWQSSYSIIGKICNCILIFFLITCNLFDIQKKYHLQFILIKICQSVMPCYIDCYLQTIYINFSPSVLGLGFIKICQSEKLNNKSGHKYEYCKTKLTPYNRLNCICKSLIILRARLMGVFILAIWCVADMKEKVFFLQVVERNLKGVEEISEKGSNWFNL